MCPKAHQRDLEQPRKTLFHLITESFQITSTSADGMGWDLIIAPSESGKEWNKDWRLAPSGQSKIQKAQARKAMIRSLWLLVVKSQRKTKKALKVFFGKMSDRFEEPSISESLSKDLPADDMQKDTCLGRAIR